MKQLKRYRKWLWLLAIPFLVVTCIDIDEVIHPEDPKANSEIEILVKIKVPAETDRANKLVFAVLAPKNWNLGANATVHLTSADYKEGPVDEAMTQMPADEKCKANSTGQYPEALWKDAFMARFGVKDNYNKTENLEWVVFQSQSVFDFKNGELATGQVLLKFRSTNENVKVNMGYAICGKEDGLDDHADVSKDLEITGGEGALTDYTFKEGELNISTQSVTQPYKPQVNSVVELGAVVKLDGKSGCKSPLTFGMLALKSWNLGTDAAVTMTTSGYHFGKDDKGQPVNADVTDEPMTMVGDEDLEPVSEKPWKEAFMDKFGKMGNYGDEVEWVVFRSATDFDIDGKSDDITCNLKVKFTTGADNLKVNLGYAFCGENYGFTEKYLANETHKPFIVGGGQNLPKTDYTWNPAVEWTEPVLYSTTPSVLRYGDIFSVVFDAAGEYYELLSDATKVFLHAKVVYNGNQEKNVKVRMQNIRDKVWQKYLYPKTFFDLPEGAVINNISFHVSNENESILIFDGGEDGSGDNYSVAESEQ